MRLAIRRVGLLLIVAGMAACASGPSRLQPKPTATTTPPLAATVPSVRDRDLGLSKTSVFETPEPKPFVYQDDSDPIAPAYVGAPPLVSHTVQDKLPITLQKNKCVGCHDIGERGRDDPPPIPKSHYYDLRNAPTVKRAEIAGTRWVCTSCHVPQATSPPLVENKF